MHGPLNFNKPSRNIYYFLVSCSYCQISIVVLSSYTGGTLLSRTVLKLLTNPYSKK